MITDRLITEKRFADAKADEYRSLGYLVSREELLENVPGFRADLVVRKDGHTKVVEVRTQSSLAAAEQLDEVARVINDTPGWSFELHLLGDADQSPVPAVSQDFAETDIIQHLRTAEQLYSDGFVEAAFMTAWAATEAATRILVGARGVSIESVKSPGYLLNQAAFHNAIHPEEYDHLRELSTYRNAVVHGLQAPGLKADMVRDLIAIAHRFLASAQPASDFSARIDTLGEFRDGWLVGTGSAPSEQGLNWLSARFTETFQDDAPPPYAEPTPSGGVELVWPIGRKAVNLDIDLHSHLGRLSEYDRLSDTWSERELDLDDDRNWQWLLAEIRHITEEQARSVEERLEPLREPSNQ